MAHLLDEPHIRYECAGIKGIGMLGLPLLTTAIKHRRAQLRLRKAPPNENISCAPHWDLFRGSLKRSLAENTTFGVLRTAGMTPAETQQQPHSSLQASKIGKPYFQVKDRVTTLILATITLQAPALLVIEIVHIVY